MQAAIAALHVEEPQDWAELAVLYGELGRITGSPIVELNHAVAVAEAGDVRAGLAQLEHLDLDGYHYLHATRAELLSGSRVWTRPARPMNVPSSWFTPMPSADSSSRSWPSSTTDD